MRETHTQRMIRLHAELRREDALAHPAVVEAIARARDEGRQEGERLRTLVPCRDCGRGYPWRDLRDVRCIDCAIAVHQVATAVAAGELGEGQAVAMTGLDRLAVRELVQDAHAAAVARWKAWREAHQPQLGGASLTGPLDGASITYDLTGGTKTLEARCVLLWGLLREGCNIVDELAHGDAAAEEWLGRVAAATTADAGGSDAGA